MSIKIIRPGVLSTMQDGGRYGYRGIGIGSGGAMDIFAMKVAQYLCGNEDSEAVIEMNFPAPEILFEKDAIISITGADFSAFINETIIPAWSTLMVKKDSILKFKQPVSGAKVYLAVHGGWQAEKWLGSYSTHGKLAAGGFKGRALQKDDRIDFTENKIYFINNKILPWHISRHELNNIYQPSYSIHCIPGAEYELLTEWSKRNLEQQEFTISNKSDRMGYHLNNQPLLLQRPIELVSSAVDMGTLQLLPTGDCIVLMADHQTTGGYPRIASVIKADLPKLAQAKPGQIINFTMIALQEAEDKLLCMQKTLQEIKGACHFNLKKYIG